MPDDAEDVAAVALARIRAAGLDARLVSTRSGAGTYNYQLHCGEDITAPIYLAASLDEVIAMLPEPYATAAALPVAPPLPVLPPLPSGLVWNVSAVHLGVEVRADGVRLSVTIAWELFDQEYVVLAIESADGASDDAVLAEHAHQLLGRFKTEAEAKEAGERFATKWREGADAAACDCGPIEEVR